MLKRVALTLCSNVNCFRVMLKRKLLSRYAQTCCFRVVLKRVAFMLRSNMYFRVVRKRAASILCLNMLLSREANAWTTYVKIQLILVKLLLTLVEFS